jgi:hypothetical protein
VTSKRLSSIYIVVCADKICLGVLGWACSNNTVCSINLYMCCEYMIDSRSTEVQCYDSQYCFGEPVCKRKYFTFYVKFTYVGIPKGSSIFYRKIMVRGAGGLGTGTAACAPNAPHHLLLSKWYPRRLASWHTWAHLSADNAARTTSHSRCLCSD